jgi:hypothetical protein
VNEVLKFQRKYTHKSNFKNTEYSHIFLIKFYNPDIDTFSNDLTKIKEPGHKVNNVLEPALPFKYEKEDSGTDLNQIIKTSDLISWSLQIARGMEFLASKKVTTFTNTESTIKKNKKEICS